MSSSITLRKVLPEFFNLVCTVLSVSFTVCRSQHYVLALLPVCRSQHYVSAFLLRQRCYDSLISQLQGACSALHIACKDGRQEIVRLILKAAEEQNLYELESDSATNSADLPYTSDSQWIINKCCGIKVRMRCNSPCPPTTCLS